MLLFIVLVVASDVDRHRDGRKSNRDRRFMKFWWPGGGFPPGYILIYLLLVL